MKVFPANFFNPWIEGRESTFVFDPNDHGHEPGEVFPIKCPLVDAVSVYRERESNDRERINQAIAIEAKEALKHKDWDAVNWTRYQTVLEGE